MSKVYRYMKNGGIEFRDESIPENGFAPKESDAWHTIKASGVQIEPYIKSADEALSDGVAFISQFFSDWRLQDLTALISLGTEAQRMMIADVYQWMSALKMQAFQNPTAFEPSGHPPHTYSEIIGAQ